MTRKILRLSLQQQQFELLEKLMADVHATSRSAFIVDLLSKEEQARLRPNRVGRPKKDGQKEEVLWYPAPYDPKAPPYTMDDLEAYYTFRNLPVPQQGAPLTKAELKRWDM